MKDTILLIDFDSTFVTIESLDVLAEIALREKSDRDTIIEKIKKITTLGMEGKITFPESLKQRLTMFAPQAKHINELIDILKKSITPSFKEYKDYIKRHKESIYILSGGFTNYMAPVLQKFGIDKDHVLGNELFFDNDGMFLGYNQDHPLAKEKGKVKMVEQMNFVNPLIMVGDGYTDFEIKQARLAKKFIAFTENVEREVVVQYADAVAKNFQEVIALL